MKNTILLLSLFLGACASSPKIPETVSVPVAVKCVTLDPVPPTYRFIPPYDLVIDVVRDLMGDREASLAYETELRAALKSCK